MRNDLVGASKQVKDMIEAVNTHFIHFIKDRIATQPSLAMNIDSTCMYYH